MVATNPNAKQDGKGNHKPECKTCDGIAKLKTPGGWAKMVILSQTLHWNGGAKQWCSQNISSKKVLLPYKKVPLKSGWLPWRLCTISCLGSMLDLWLVWKAPLPQKLTHRIHVSGQIMVDVEIIYCCWCAYPSQWQGVTYLGPDCPICEQANYSDQTAEVTPNGGLVGNPLRMPLVQV